ncbi:Ig-like domain-containing protein [bacterium]|nr:Ig-like domain-containing protein [bacterium]
MTDTAPDQMLDLRTKRQFLFSILLLFGCEGDPGKHGVSLLPEDIRTPEVILILPLAQSNIYDSVVLEAFAVDDSSIGDGKFQNIGTVEQVEFLIDGVLPEDDRLVLTDPPWQVSWDCSGLSEGRHSIQARAWDGAGHWGLSSLVFVNKTDPSLKPRNDTLRSYLDTEGEEDKLLWTLPDMLEWQTGIGTRFVPDGPCIIRSFRTRLYVDTYVWAGNKQIAFEIWSSLNNQPDSLLYADTTSVNSLLRFEPPLDWAGFNVIMRSEIHLSGDFFVLLTPADDSVGDSLGILTDNGLWRNYHGVVRRDGEWVHFAGGPQTVYNPLIYAVVIYE